MKLWRAIHLASAWVAARPGTRARAGLLSFQDPLHFFNASRAHIVQPPVEVGCGVDLANDAVDDLGRGFWAVLLEDLGQCADPLLGQEPGLLARLAAVSAFARFILGLPVCGNQVLCHLQEALQELDAVGSGLKLAVAELVKTFGQRAILRLVALGQSGLDPLLDPVQDLVRIWKLVVATVVDLVEDEPLDYHRRIIVEVRAPADDESPLRVDDGAE